MLTLLYGTRRAREEIYRRIRRDTDGARRAYLIVPDQKALLAEGELAAVLPPRARRSVFAAKWRKIWCFMENCVILNKMHPARQGAGERG